MAFSAGGTARTLEPAGVWDVVSVQGGGSLEQYGGRWAGSCGTARTAALGRAPKDRSGRRAAEGLSIQKAHKCLPSHWLTIRGQIKDASGLSAHRKHSSQVHSAGVRPPQANVFATEIQE